MIAWTKLFASASRQKCLDDASIKYVVDQDFNFGFRSHDELLKAVNELEAALEYCSNERVY